MTRLLIATTNPGKIREIRRVLDGVRVEILTLADLPPIVEPEETGLTFAENARLKARYYAGASGLPTVAEDSGLAIDALDGRPGVQSARYPGDTYPEKFANLYRELAGHPQPWRARFLCALAFVDQAQVAFECEGIVPGEVIGAPRGANGFGYDPIFFYPPYGKTLGEATDAEKLVVSHRGQAFRQFRAWLDAR
ncbi:MAG TPA: RdgB/HAM1 family non-canonical purine NTP pyrophosphatase [Vicinamibacterales bacterium]|nr:RdgB/HAM1 family non-canonical purine NTP pyrophosphatase [Vicinamibacterales bacterium]